MYRVATAWGFTSIDWRSDSVVAVSPPIDYAQLGDAADALAVSAPAPVRALARALRAYFDGERVELAPRADVERWLDATGVSGARCAMALTLFDVPRGVTLSYGELATLAGYPGAARAAGSMCARNPLPLVIPCHRVLHAGARPGDVGAYGAATGSSYKRRLLELEDAAIVRGRT